jgi:hypothetical protein
MSLDLIDRYRADLLGKKLSHTWQGQGSAIFLEFGDLTPRARRDGSPGNPDGEFGAMIEWSWRIERPNSIICGSWSDEALWEGALQRLRGGAVTDVAVFGRLPELAIELSDGHRVLSFMTSDGDPQWTLFDRRSPRAKWLCVRDGAVVEEISAV